MALTLLDDEDDEEEAAKPRLPSVKDPSTIKALKKLDDEIKSFEYKAKFDLKVALAKNNNSYRQARRYLRWQELALQEGQIKRAEREEEEKQQQAVERRKLGLAPTYGEPTLRNPIQDLIRGRKKPYSESEVIQRRVAADLPQKVLTLENRRLEDLPAFLGTNLFLQLAKPRSASFARNKIQVLIIQQSGFTTRTLRSITTLNLTANSLEELPANMGLLQSLKTLMLDINRLSELPASITQLRLLSHLSAQQNNLVRLPAGTGELTALKHLNLSNNTLSELPPTFTGLSSLTLLDLSENKFQHLAIIPSPRLQLWARRSSPLEWLPVPDEETGVLRYFHKVTGSISTKRPAAMRELDPPEKKKAGVRHSKGPRLSEEEVARRRTLIGLAIRGAREWDTPTDPNTGFIQYRKVVTQEEVTLMPAELDTLGCLEKLVVFKANNNQLKQLPDSMARMAELEVVECKGNYLRKLPSALKRWTRVRRMVFTCNDISFAPDVFAPLTALKELHLTSNVLSELPASLGQCRSLCKLMVGNNSLTRLPPSFGYLSNLRELQVFNNPIEDPPMHLISGDRNELLWLLRKKHLEEVRGPPPAMAVHRRGIQGELVVLQPQFEVELRKKLSQAAPTQQVAEGKALPKGPEDAPALQSQPAPEDVDLRLQGLTSLPPALFERGGIRRLDLGFNTLGSEPIVFSSPLSTVVELSLWKCGLSELDPSISCLASLTSLNVEENKLRTLPDTFVKLRSLTHLRLSQNTLCTLPKRFGALNSLTDLSMDNNVLESLPSSFSRLVSLKKLSLARNKLPTLESFMTTLVKLESLNLDGNLITSLPPGLGRLKCKQLCLSFNRLEYLDEDTFRPNLYQSLVSLKLAWNNLMELPLNFFECTTLTDFTYECNPLKSPPAELLAEDLGSIYKYGKLRQIRIKEIQDLLEQAGFDFEPQAVTPITRGLITGKTGFLVPEDLKDFDEVVDEYVNGPFYRCSYTGVELVGKLKRLREQRNQDFYKNVLDAVLRVIEQELPEDLYGAGVLLDEVKRPWGKDGESVKCYGLALHALMSERPAYADTDVYRPALYKQAVDSLPPTVFAYSKKALREAVKSLRHPYGRVAYVEMLEYPICECIDPDTGEFINHIPCNLPSLVILRTIYTAEEAKRRQEEEDEVIAAFKNIEEQIAEFAQSKEGRLKVKEEVTYRRERHAGAILSRENKAQQTRNEIQSCKNMLASIKKREVAFLQGLPFEYHRISSRDEVDRLIGSVNAEIEGHEEVVAVHEREIKTLEKERKMGDGELTCKAWADLVHKYCFFESEKLLYTKRRLAFRNRWRRPWDGEDGAAFLQWMGHRSHPDIKLDWSRIIKRLNKLEAMSKLSGEEEEEEEEETDDEDEDLPPEYSFADCEHMEVYDNEYTNKYLAVKENRFEKAWEKFSTFSEDMKSIGQDIIKLFKR